MDLLERTGISVRRAVPFVSLAVLGAGLVLGRHEGLSLPLQVVFSLLWLMTTAGHVRVWHRAATPNIRDWAQSHLSLLACLAVLAGVCCTDSGLDSPAYAVVFLIVMVTSVVSPWWGTAETVVGVMIVEGGMNGVRGTIGTTTFFSHGALAVAFAVAGYCLLRLELVRLRSTMRVRVKAELSRLQDAARSYRLFGTPVSVRGETVEKAKDEERAARSGVEEIHQAVLFSLDLVRHTMGLQTALLLWLNETGTHLRMAERSTERDDVSDGPFLAGDGIFGAALAQRAPVSRGGLRPDSRLPYYDSDVQRAGSVCAVPAFEQGILRGLLVVDRRDTRPFTEIEEEILLTATRHAVRAIENERLFVQLERAKVEQGKLYRAAEALGGAGNEADVVEAAVRSAREVAAFDFAAVTLFDSKEETHEIRAVSGEGTEPLLGARFAHNGGLVAMVVQNRFTLPYRGELEGKRQVVFSNRLSMPPSTMSVLVLPLIVRENPLGTLVLGARRRGAFGEAVRPTLEVLARHVAVSLANARMVKKLEAMATTDSMTGLLNKRAMLEAATEKLASSYRFSRNLSVVIVDIDFFKKVNDTYGHDIGDVVIKGLGDILQRAKRTTDSVARFGGEEFVLLCEETDTPGAVRLAERIREELSRTSFITPTGALRVTCSLGVATFPTAGRTWDALFKSADDALYTSKKGGRDRTTAWSPGQRKPTAA